MGTETKGLEVSTTVNGKARHATVAPGLLLVDFLRDGLELTGTKVGCESGQCGACVVLLDGLSVKSCAVLAAQVDGREVTTVEGLASNGLSPLQESLWDNHAVQCGFCTPGLLVGMTDLLSHNSHPEEAEIRAWMDGIMCRCSVYQNAVRAVKSVADGVPQPGGE